MRLAFRSRRQRLLWTGAAVLGTAALLLLLRPETAPVPEPPAMPPVAPPIVAPPPPLVPAAPAPVAASTAGLQLTGVLGYAGSRGAAIFALPDGRQRLVAVGRDVAPGVRLESVAADRATVNDGVQRLEFVLPELQATSAAPPVPVAAPTPAVAAPADPQPDLASFRAALKPEGDPGRPRGYRIDGSAPLAALDRAGLRAGDIVLAVNGRPLDEARLRELPAELVGATSVEIEYERAGRRLRATVPTGG